MRKTNKRQIEKIKGIGKLPVDITFKNVIIIMACVIKGDDKFYPQLLLEEALLEA